MSDKNVDLWNGLSHLYFDGFRWCQKTCLCQRDKDSQSRLVVARSESWWWWWWWQCSRREENLIEFWNYRGGRGESTKITGGKRFLFLCDKAIKYWKSWNMFELHLFLQHKVVHTFVLQCNFSDTKPHVFFQSKVEKWTFSDLTSRLALDGAEHSRHRLKYVHLLPYVLWLWNIWIWKDGLLPGWI